MRAILLTLVAASACGKDKAPEPAPAPAPAAAPTEPAAAAPAPAAPAPDPAAAAAEPAPPEAPAAGEMTCDTLLPAAIRAKYLSTATINPVASRKEHQIGCKVVIDNVGMYTVGAWCDEDAVENISGLIASTKEIVKTMKDLPGVGKAAMMQPEPPLGNSVTAWDDDSNCKLTFVLPKTVDPTAFAKDLLAILPIK